MFISQANKCKNFFLSSLKYILSNIQFFFIIFHTHTQHYIAFFKNFSPLYFTFITLLNLEFFHVFLVPDCIFVSSAPCAPSSWLSWLRRANDLRLLIYRRPTSFFFCAPSAGMHSLVRVRSRDHGLRDCGKSEDGGPRGQERIDRRGNWEDISSKKNYRVSTVKVKLLNDIVSIFIWRTESSSRFWKTFYISSWTIHTYDDF